MFLGATVKDEISKIEASSEIHFEIPSSTVDYVILFENNYSLGVVELSKKEIEGRGAYFRVAGTGNLVAEGFGNTKSGLVKSILEGKEGGKTRIWCYDFCSVGDLREEGKFEKSSSSTKKTN